MGHRFPLGFLLRGDPIEQIDGEVIVFLGALFVQETENAIAAGFKTD